MSFFDHSRILCGALLFCVFAKLSAAQDTAPDINAVLPEKQFAVFDKYCLECHDSLTEKGEVNLEDLDFDIAKDIKTAETWQKVLNAMNSGEMPPEDEKPVSDEEKTAFLDDLSNKIVTARKILGDSGGEITLRRLNRREYANTLEDLLGITPDVSLLPDDQAAAEFDTMGASLFFSSDQLEQYLSTARRTLELALLPKKQEEAKIVRYEPEEEYTAHYLEQAKELLDRAQRTYAWRATGKGDTGAKEFGYLDGYQAERQLGSFNRYFPQVQKYLDAPENKTGAAFMQTIKAGNTRMVLPTLAYNESGKYTIRLKVAAYEDDPDRFRYIEFIRKVDQSSEFLGWRKVTASLRKPQIIEFTVDHPPGMKASYFVQKRTHQDRGDKNLWEVYREENGFGTPWGIWVDWAEMEGPLPDAPNEAAAGVIFEKPEGMSPSDYSKEIIRRFAVKAFRGAEPDSEFLDRLYARYEAKRDSGLGLVQAMIDPLSIVLSSPSFLYMVESTGNEDSEKLTNHELAVRLSYFLWSAPPDEELLELAKQGKLTDPEILKEQTARMLADDRIDRFVEGFVHQWLEMERLGMFQFSGLQFPDFDNAVREGARSEIFETVKTIMTEELPLRYLLKSDFVLVNDVLAGYYGIDGVEGHEFRKVQLAENSPRGGLLGTAAVAAMGSDGLRSSPVERGAWVLRHLLNTPPPPAPPNVPQLSRLEGEVLNARDLQKAHQEQPQCAQCHRKIDPIGYGLENFDAAGMWREFEVVTIGKRKGKKETKFPIEPGGTLQNGVEFSSYFELRDAVTDQVDGFAMGLTESLITYGLGRPFGFTDHDLATEIANHAKAGDYQFHEFIHALIQSDPFQTK